MFKKKVYSSIRFFSDRVVYLSKINRDLEIFFNNFIFVKFPKTQAYSLKMKVLKFLVTFPLISLPFLLLKKN